MSAAEICLRETDAALLPWSRRLERESAKAAAASGWKDSKRTADLDQGQVREIVVL